MSDIKHTPEPWHYPGLGEIHAENHDEIAQILYHHEDDDGYCGTDDDAERIVTCVNACAGIDNGDLEKVTYAELLESHQTLESQLADATRKLEEARKDDCAWTDYGDDNMPGTYEGKCGIVWTFTEGGIADNDCIYCPRCGGKIIDQAIEQEAPSLCTADEVAEIGKQKE